MTKPKNKNSFVDLKYTAAFMVKFAAIVLAAFACLGLVLFCLLNKRLGQGYFTDISTLSGLHEKLGTILIITGIFQTVILSLIVLVLGLLWAHAVAGPLVRFQKALDMLSKGEFSEEISFRQGDQLHNLASSLKSLHRSCKTRREHLSEYLHKADAILKECISKGQGLDTKKHSQLKYMYYSMINMLRQNK